MEAEKERRTNPSSFQVTRRVIIILITRVVIKTPMRENKTSTREMKSQWCYQSTLHMTLRLAASGNLCKQENKCPSCYKHDE